VKTFWLPSFLRFTAALALALAPFIHAYAQAPAFPTKSVRLIVPNDPGGAIDLLGRLLANYLQPVWGQPVIVEYKPGAGTALGTDYVAKSAPDGYTIGMVVTSHVINPSVRKLPFDTLKDLAGITMTAVSDIVISATPSLPANNVSELIALAKKQPGKLSYASPGTGSSMHLSGELLKLDAGIDILHVPFKGSGPAYAQVMAGRIELLIDPLFSTLPYLKSGKLKPIATTGAKRAPITPDVPTVAEVIPGFDVMSINGLVVPSATPRELVRKINADMVKVLQLPEVKKRAAEWGLETVGNSPEQFDEFIRTEMAKWAKVVKAAGIQND
jgi:tripartite-type tricarboxylate transporter receptor subunit TctC